MGMAVGMASNICGFNLSEVCRATIEYLNDPSCDLTQTLQAPDFSTGGELIYNAGELASVYETGRGSFKVRAKWSYFPKENVIEITEIPYSTTSEAIIDKVAELIKAGKLREVSDMRDETGLSGLKLTIDLKRGTDPDKLMAKLMRATPLMDTFSCNFNILIAGTPRVMGVREILSEWTAWRMECVKRRVFSEAQKKKEKLHLLLGLQKILLDIDKAIKIIRETEEEREVVPNLMIGFGIDETQAEYVAEIKLRNINREYIVRRTQETSALADEIKDLEDVLSKPKRVKDIIISELKEVDKKFGAPRKTQIVYDSALPEPDEDDGAEDYPVNVFLSREGYFKKITPQSLRMAAEQKYKDNDGPRLSFSAQNKDDLLVFTDRQQCYKARLRDFEDTKASALGTYLPSFLQFDEGENVIFVTDPGDYAGSLLFVFENGKAARVELSAYATKTNRKKLTGAYSDKSPAAAVLPLAEELELAVYAADGRVLIFSTSLLAPKTTRAAQGVSLMTLKRGSKVERALPLTDTTVKNPARYRVRTIPAAGAKLTEEDSEQLQFTIDS
jgi:DNA gyrase subunit A